MYVISVNIIRCYTNTAFVFDLMKTRAQNSKQVRMSYIDEFKNIYRSEGLRGFTRGYTGMFMRDVPGFALYFFLYDLFKRAFGANSQSTFPLIPIENEESFPIEEFEEVERKGINNNIELALKQFLAGGLSGMATWSFCYPFDTIKSMMQSQKLGKDRKGAKAMLR